MIGDDDTRTLMSPTSKRALREMLAQVVANTPGAVPITKVPPEATGGGRAAMGSASASPDQPPSAYQVAVAIVAAARELKVSPEDIALGVSTMGGRGDNSLPRARAYAALALRAVCPNNGSTAIARWVGSKTPGGYLGLLDSQRRNGTMRWWDEGIFKRVVMRLQTTPREEKG